jgi:choloylglycine hydrolase
LFIVLAVIFTVLFWPLQESLSCSTFLIQKKLWIVFGRNFDFPLGAGHVHINKRNLTKTSLIQPPEIPITWTSKFGSLTFNQAGKEFPYGGINEAGLVVEQMALNESVYPEMDERFGLSELQWIQYQLDNAATVEEVIRSDNKIRISNLSVAKLHFLVADKTGDCAVLEYIDGKLVVHHQETLPFTCLTNSIYEQSVDTLRKMQQSYETDKQDHYTSNTFDRFANIAEMLERSGTEENMIDYGFEILESVSNDYTQWSIVYDLKAFKVYFKTRQNQHIKQIDIGSIDFSCESANLYGDMNLSEVNFQPFTYEANRTMINQMFDNIEFLKNIPEEFREGSARYPETTHCN